jgi:hypothetical protein
VNNRDKNYTVAKVTGRMEQVDASIARYLAALNRADREESDVAEAKSGRLKEKIAGLRRQMQALKAMEQMVQDAPDQQVSLTDPDARSMATSGKGTATVGYNVQIAVDAEHHLIVALGRLVGRAMRPQNPKLPSKPSGNFQMKSRSDKNLLSEPGMLRPNH